MGVLRRTGAKPCEAVGRAFRAKRKLAHKAGQVAGKARAGKLRQKRRSEIARKAAETRWAKAKEEP